MSDNLLPIYRVAELDNVGIITIYHERRYESCFVMVELKMLKGIPTLHCLAMQKVYLDTDTQFNNNNPIVETLLLATPYEGGYGAAIHDFVLWWIYNNNPAAVSIADRSAVSPDAAKVREIYAKQRKGSVKAFPIDNKDEKLTLKLDDDYKTHFQHGGFDVYPEYKQQRMAHTRQAYKDWAVKLTQKGYKEIAPACEHLNKMGNHILSFMESQLDIKTKDQLDDMKRTIAFYAIDIFGDVLAERYRVAMKKRITLNGNGTMSYGSGEPHIAPRLDKTKKKKRKLGSYTYNPRRRTRRRL